MALTAEERIEFLLMSEERGFQETGTVAGKARSGRPKSATDETQCQPQSEFLSPNRGKKKTRRPLKVLKSCF